MAPHIELFLKLLREIGLMPLQDSTRDLCFLPIESGTERILLNMEVQESVVNFSCVALPVKKIPVPSEGALNRSVLQAETRLCRYSRDPMGNVILGARIPFDLLTKELLSAIIEEIRSESAAFSAKLIGTFPLEGSVILFPARLQPPHKGHFDGIVRLLEGDESVLADPYNEENVRLLKKLRALVVSIKQVSREKGNPLHLGERRDLVQWEINQNARLQKHACRITLEPCPVGDPNYWLPALLRNLPDQPDAIATANPQTLVAARDVNLRAIAMARDANTFQSGKNVRKLIAEDNLEMARTLLSTPVFERCQSKGYFRTIKDIETAY